MKHAIELLDNSIIKEKEMLESDENRIAMLKLHVEELNEVEAMAAMRRQRIKELEEELREVEDIKYSETA